MIGLTFTLRLVIWVGQGNYLTLCSDQSTIGRNSGIVWALLQCSLPFGGIFLYTQFRQNSESIPVSTIKLVYICFITIALVGTLILALLKPLKRIADGSESEQPIIVESDSVVSAVDGASLKNGEEMHSGLQELGFLLTFWSGIYGTSLAYTLNFAVKTQGLLALNAIFIGLGETFGGSVFGLFGKQLVHNRNTVIILGIITNYVYSILGAYYAKDSSKSFALYKFFQSLAAAAGFYYDIMAVTAVNDSGFGDTELLQDDDEDLDETLLERIQGLCEMFPESFRNVFGFAISSGIGLSKSLFFLTRKILWITTTSATVILLPFLFVKEISEVEQMQLQQQRQILFGPSQALASGSHAGIGGLAGGRADLFTISHNIMFTVNSSKSRYTY
ncbi:unnamed protein product [Soboliphyme baturini]|uniref:Mitochondrial import receptor subunit TOM22 homolog n=1 Tax=Soboliphyme baturini TaxID=241478 RepID=A0A183IKC7_9BILA|nr:unnamed protein product [Soboliphyme baturini]